MNAKATAPAPMPGMRPVDKTSQTDDERIRDITVLPPRTSDPLLPHPRHRGGRALITDTRRTSSDIMRGQDDRLLVVIGPAPSTTPLRRWTTRALRKAVRAAVHKRHAGGGDARLLREATHHRRLEGPDQRPYLDESYRIDEGLRIARQLLIDINRLGVPVASEFLDVISPQYIGDLISWGAIGARTTESQVHRELASARRRPSASRTAPTATSASPPTPSRPPAAATISCRCTRTAGGHRADQWQQGLPRHPARRQDAELRRRQRGHRL